jgi:hypothetical protein
MITMAVFVALVLVSVRVRQLAHRAAMFAIDIIGLGCVFVAAALEGQTRRRRMFGLVLFAVFFFGLWATTTLVMRLILQLP